MRAIGTSPYKVVFNRDPRYGRVPEGRRGLEIVEVRELEWSEDEELEENRRTHPTDDDNAQFEMDYYQHSEEEQRDQEALDKARDQEAQADDYDLFVPQRDPPIDPDRKSVV